jgi:hypothetical protein
VQMAITAGHRVVNITVLAYAGNLHFSQDFKSHADLGDARSVSAALNGHHPEALVSFADEKHVVGTAYRLESVAQPTLRFLPVSTHRGCGSVGETGAFTKPTPSGAGAPYQHSWLQRGAIE